MPSTSEKQVNETPAANQNEPRWCGKTVSARSSSIGSRLGWASGSSAWMNGNVAEPRQVGRARSSAG